MKTRPTILVATAVCGLLAGFFFRPLQAPSNPVTVQLEEIESKDEIYQNDIVPCWFRITNNVRRPTTIIRFGVSCGCMLIAGADGKTLEAPYTMADGETLSCVVRVDTRGKTGIAVQDVEIVAQTDGGPVSTRLPIRLDVRPGCWAEPSELRFVSSDRQESLEGVVLLKSPVGMEDNISEPIVVSDPSRVHIRVEVADEPVEYVELVTGSREWTKVGYKSRYKLYVTYSPPVTTDYAVDYIDIPLKRGTRLSIPVYYHAESNGMALVPSAISVQQSDTITLRSVTISGTSGQIVKVKSAPDWVTAKIVSAEGNRTTLGLEIDSKRATADVEPTVLLECGSQRCSLPVRVFSMSSSGPTDK